MSRRGGFRNRNGGNRPANGENRGLPYNRGSRDAPYKSDSKRGFGQYGGGNSPNGRGNKQNGGRNGQFREGNRQNDGGNKWFGGGNGPKNRSNNNDFPAWMRNSSWLTLIRYIYTSGNFNQEQLWNLASVLLSMAAIAIESTWTRAEQLGYSDAQIVQCLNLPDETFRTLQALCGRMNEVVYGPDLEGDVPMFDANEGAYINPNHFNSRDPLRDVFDFLRSQFLGHHCPVGAA
ncbi:hypothetical protein VTK26DRAFT_7097 [Humicola hyalothermophila]